MSVFDQFGQSALGAFTRQMNDLHRQFNDPTGLGAVARQLEEAQMAYRPIRTIVDDMRDMFPHGQLDRYGELQTLIQGAGLGHDWSTLQAGLAHQLDGIMVNDAIQQAAQGYDSKHLARLADIGNVLNGVHDSNILKAVAGEANRIRAQVEALQPQMDAWRSALEPLSSAGVGLARDLVNASFETNFASLRQAFAPQWLVQAPGLADQISDLLVRAGDFEIEFDEDGELIVDGQLVNEDELRDALDELGTEAAESESTPQGLRTFLAIANEWAKENPILFWVVCSLLTFLLSQFDLPQLSRSTGRSPNKLIEQRLSDVVEHSQYPAFAFRNNRWVATERLLAYRKAMQRSGRIGVLYRARVVTIVQRHRNWTQVQWRDQGEILTGWVFSRYLRRVESKRRPSRARRSCEEIPGQNRTTTPHGI